MKLSWVFDSRLVFEFFALSGPYGKKSDCPERREPERTFRLFIV
jgi:hypothetical protein